MRLSFPNLDRPKKAAKSFKSLLGLPLATSQNLVAHLCGYRDWFDLKQATTQAASGTPSALDQVLPHADFIARQVDLTLKLSSIVGIPQEDAQYALLRSHLSGDRPPALRDQLAIRAACLRSSSLPDRGRRQPGSVGRIKSRGWGNAPVILRRFGAPTQCLGHGGNTFVADFEFVTPRTPIPLFIPERLYLAYGVWTEADGARVLFSRDYKPLWRLREDRSPELVSPAAWIRYVEQEWFWADRNPPWDDPVRSLEEHQRLEDLGVHGVPRLAAVLPLLVNEPQINVNGAVERLYRQKSA